MHSRSVSSIASLVRPYCSRFASAIWQNLTYWSTISPVPVPRNTFTSRSTLPSPSYRSDKCSTSGTSLRVPVYTMYSSGRGIFTAAVPYRFSLCSSTYSLYVAARYISIRSDMLIENRLCDSTSRINISLTCRPTSLYIPVVRMCSNVTSLQSASVTSVSSGCNARYSLRAYSGCFIRNVNTLSFNVYFISAIGIPPLFFIIADTCPLLQPSIYEFSVSVVP